MKSPFHSCSKHDTVCDEELPEINGTECTAGLTIVSVPLWEEPPSRGPRTNVEFFTTLFGRLNVEITFTKHNFCLRWPIHVRFRLKHRRIPIQYTTWLARFVCRHPAINSSVD